MKLVHLALAGALTMISAHAGTVQYFTSNGGEPWSVTDFTDAMTTVFGSYTTNYYETADATPFSAGTSFVFMEGSAGNDTALQSYLTTYGSAIMTWVSNGGRLMINSAGWDNGITTPFGDITFNWDDSDDFSSSNGAAVGSSDPLFLGPYTPVSTALTGGWFAHDTVTGTGLTPLVTGDVGTIVASATYGSGLLLFSGETAPSFQNPQPDSFNLLNNELEYASGFTPSRTLAPEPGSMALIGAGLLFVAVRRRSRAL